LISDIVQLATDGLVPDLTLLFDVPVQESVNRTTRRSSVKNNRDRLDIEAADFHSRVREAYLKIAATEPERVKVIDTSGPVEITHERVKGIVVPFLRSRGHFIGAANSSAPFRSRR
jgi:dTMP kinase